MDLVTERGWCRMDQKKKKPQNTVAADVPLQQGSTWSSVKQPGGGLEAEPHPQEGRAGASPCNHRWRRGSRHRRWPREPSSTGCLWRCFSCPRSCPAEHSRRNPLRQEEEGGEVEHNQQTGQGQGEEREDQRSSEQTKQKHCTHRNLPPTGVKEHPLQGQATKTARRPSSLGAPGEAGPATALGIPTATTRGTSGWARSTGEGSQEPG